jgi:hypothetical protein
MCCNTKDPRKAAFLRAAGIVDEFACGEIDESDLDRQLTDALLELLAAPSDADRTRDDIRFLVGQLRLAALERDEGRTPTGLASTIMSLRETQHPYLNS